LKPEYRKRGIGEKSLKTAEKSLKKEGIRKIF
jgi:ribosomal protein S18 acetylase RimI-like enzyme